MDHTLHPIQIASKVDHKPNCKTITQKLPEENKGENLFDLCLKIS
jgi:hypothetical protein